jgi:hypothetical protein
VSSGLAPLPNQPSLRISNSEGTMHDDKVLKERLPLVLDRVAHLRHVFILHVERAESALTYERDSRIAHGRKNFSLNS